jgi:glycosyltransferase involved in cell wall biosynthesis
MLESLLITLRPQIVPGVEVVMEIDDGEDSIGVKRNRLLSNAFGEYVCFIDDDDQVSRDYVRLILDALDGKPDCVGFNLRYYVDGTHKGDAIHSLRYQNYGQHRDGRLMVYERTPNHLNPIRRDVALQVGFPDKNHGEDTDFAVTIRPLLKTEVFIDQTLYHYLYRSTK